MASIETASSQLSESLHQAEIDNMLEFLSKKSEDELRLKNQQRGEPDLSSEQKLEILRECLNTNPAVFLSRFGRHLSISQLDSFNLIRNKNYDVKFYLEQLEKTLSPGVKELQRKNRRYEALQRLVDTTDYFNEEEMQRRNPILFEQLIGRYHTKEEREAFLQLSAKSSSSGGGLSGQNVSRPTPLSDMLIAHMNRAPGEYSDRRIDQENQIHDEEVAESHYHLEDDDDESVEMDGIEYERKEGKGSISASTQENHEPEEIEDEEKDVLKEEFFTTMYRCFLNGKDVDFDYSTVDNNPDYDCGETLDQDAEDKYFEAEDTRSNSSATRMCEGSDTDNEGSRNPVQGTHNIEEEDELDVFMKGIESELSQQKQFST